MSVKFKLSADASEASVKHVLDALNERGLAADRLFPDQQRPSLARMFIIRAPSAQVADVAATLERFGSDVEYVESDVKRKPL